MKFELTKDYFSIADGSFIFNKDGYPMTRTSVEEEPLLPFDENGDLPIDLFKELTQVYGDYPANSDLVAVYYAELYASEADGYNAQQLYAKTHG